MYLTPQNDYFQFSVSNISFACVKEKRLRKMFLLRTQNIMFLLTVIEIVEFQI